MAKIATINDQPPIATSGRWTWNDEKHNLEYISGNSNADKQDKRRRGKDHNTKRTDRVASSLPNRSHPAGRGRSQGLSNHAKSPRPHKSDGSNSVVTLSDIKNVAQDKLDQDKVSESFLYGLYHTEQFDDFLLYLLNYFHCFFDKMTQENKQNPMYIEASRSEKKAYADACAELDVAQKLLGQAYCVLVLGLGMEDQHHMGCGMSRVSATYKDRSMYETLYTFCTFVVWIAFRRKEFEIVKKEIGRMLRSDTFNPAIRIKHAPEDKKDQQIKLTKTDSHEKSSHDSTDATKDEIVKLTPAEYRRRQLRRPAIKSIINQRSPVVISILPSPKEEAHWLFKRTRALSPTALETFGRDGDDPSDEELKKLEGLSIDKRNFKVGILGEPLNQFNPVTLTPIGVDNDDEDNEGCDGDDKQPGEEQRSSTPPGDKGNRQHTSMSHATTEAHTDDEGE